MQNLCKLLVKLGTVSVTLNAMQNRAVSHMLAVRVKQASRFINADYQDIADTCADYMAEYPNDFCEEDLARLRTTAMLLQEANALLHKVQDTVLSASC